MLCTAPLCFMGMGWSWIIWSSVNPQTTFIGNLFSYLWYVFIIFANVGVNQSCWLQFSLPVLCSWGVQIELQDMCETYSVVRSFFVMSTGGACSLRVLLSFAVGCLLGDVFLHLLPEVWMEQHEAVTGELYGVWRRACVTEALYCILKVSS